MMEKKYRSIGATALCIMLLLVCTLLASCRGTEASISLNKSEVSMCIGDSVKLIATASDEKAEVEWSTSDEQVAVVRRGTVTAVGEGTAVITASIEDGVSASCTVNVSARTFTISQTTAIINLDESNTLTLTATSSDNGEITWTSSDPNVATVVGGVVRAYEIGNVTITAQCGSSTATCEIEIIMPSLPEDYYKIEKRNNSSVISNPGIWYYHADGMEESDFDFSEYPVHMNGTASATLSKIPNVAGKQYFYLRYQPDIVEVGSYYTISVTITVSESTKLKISSKRADGSTDASVYKTFEANVPQTIEYVGCRNLTEPFWIRLHQAIDAESFSISVQLNSITPHDGTDLPSYHTKNSGSGSGSGDNTPSNPSLENGYYLESGKNSVVVADPGKWYYFCDGNSGSTGEYELVGTPKFENGVLSYAFKTMATLNSSGKQPSYQLRYQPEFAVGITYTVTFTVTVDAAGEVVVGYGTENTTFEFEEAGSKTITWIGVVQEGTPFYIGLRSVDRTAPITMTVSDISFTEGATEDPTPDPDEPVVESYDLESGKNSVVIADPDKWYYSCDTGYEFASAPKMENGVITFSFNYMNSEASASYQLRYQPNYEVGTEITITFTVTLSAPGKIYCGTDSSNRDYYDMESEAGSLTITWTGAVHESEAFRINIRSTERTAPITMTISNIAITENTAE